MSRKAAYPSVANIAGGLEDLGFRIELGRGRGPTGDLPALEKAVIYGDAQPIVVIVPTGNTQRLIEVEEKFDELGYDWEGAESMVGGTKYEIHGWDQKKLSHRRESIVNPSRSVVMSRREKRRRRIGREDEWPSLQKVVAAAHTKLSKISPIEFELDRSRDESNEYRVTFRLEDTKGRRLWLGIVVKRDPRRGEPSVMVNFRRRDPSDFQSYDRPDTSPDTLLRDLKRNIEEAVEDYKDHLRSKGMWEQTRSSRRRERRSSRDLCSSCRSKQSNMPRDIEAELREMADRLSSIVDRLDEDYGGIGPLADRLTQIEHELTDIIISY